MLSGRRKLSLPGSDIPLVKVNQTTPIVDPRFVHLVRRLEQAGQLLLSPTPEAVRDAGLLLEDASETLKRECTSSIDSAGDMAAQIQEVERIMVRTRQLLEGAARVQWARLRKITAVTQSYAPGGVLSKWQPSSPTLDVQV